MATSYKYTFPKEEVDQAVDFINNVNANLFSVRASSTVYNLEGETCEQTFMDLVDATANATFEVTLEVDWEARSILVDM